MKVKSINLKKFRRFEELTIEKIDPAAKLVVLIGPNGCGKSALFDAFLQTKNWSKGNFGFDNSMQDYFSKSPNLPLNNTYNFKKERINIQFHDKGVDLEKKIYIRSAYRNEPDFHLQSVSTTQHDKKLDKMISEDKTVSRNYQKLLSIAMNHLLGPQDDELPKGEVREKITKEIADILQRLFDTLNLATLSNPLSGGSFKFHKGKSRNFHYKNLSGGEKAAFDLILDLFVHKSEFQDAIFCIDEPELHINSRLQRKLLNEICNLIPDCCQLWIATHSLGMMREAQRMYQENPNSVVFLDFFDRDFDNEVKIEPTIPNRDFWSKVNDILLDDIAHLVTSENIILCEGKEDQTTDSACYNTIFSEDYPHFQFCSVGSHTEVTKGITILKGLVQSNIYKLIDRDDRSDNEVKSNKEKRVITLGRRNIESYLWDDEILKKLCDKHNKPDSYPKIIEEKESLLANSSPQNDLSNIAGSMYKFIKEELQLNNCGNEPKVFMRDTLASLCTKDTKVYKDLKKDIFDEIKK